MGKSKQLHELWREASQNWRKIEIVGVDIPLEHKNSIFIKKMGAEMIHNDSIRLKKYIKNWIVFYFESS